MPACPRAAASQLYCFTDMVRTAYIPVYKLVMWWSWSKFAFVKKANFEFQNSSNANANANSGIYYISRSRNVAHWYTSIK